MKLCLEASANMAEYDTPLAAAFPWFYKHMLPLRHAKKGSAGKVDCSTSALALERAESKSF